MPPPAPIFWKKVDENQVCYFIWPNVETPASLIFEPFVPAHFGVTGRKTVIIRVHPRITALYPPTLALTARSRDPFHLGCTYLLNSRYTVKN